MTKNQIVKFIKIYISSNYSGKPFYKMEFNPKKYLDDEISIYSLKLISSGNVDFQNLLPSLEVIAKHNSFNDENLSVDITLRNQNNTLFAPIHIGLREYQFMTKNQLVKIIDEKLFEVYDLNFCQNELTKYNLNFNQDMVVELYKKIAVLNHKLNQEEISDLDKRDFERLINYYNNMLNDFILKNNINP